MSIFDHRKECMPRTNLQQVQLERLQALIARLKRNVRRVRATLGGLHVSDLRDLRNVPFTTPEALLDAFPYGMFALPLREVVRLHSIVGPRGNPLVLGFSRNDLNQWARLTARQLAAAGVTSGDVIQISFLGGLFNDAFGYMLGAEQIGASVAPQEPFHIEYQLDVLRNYRTTVLVTTPTNARRLVALLEDNEIDPQSLHLRTVILSRTVPPDERERIAQGLFASVFTAFGVPEVGSPGFAFECEEGRLHVNEDHFLTEEVDGELVITTMTREAMPLLRYRTRISGTLVRERCPCGRTSVTVRPGPRLDNQILVNEMPLYREQIAAVLDRTKARKQPFRILVSEERVAVDIAISEDFFADEMRVLVELKDEIQAEFLTRLGIDCEVRYVSSVREDEEEDGAAEAR